MSIPGFTPSGSAWQSPVPGWVPPSRTVTQIDSPITVTLAGITIESNPASRTDYRSLETIDGWWDGVDVRQSVLDRPGADGELEGQQLLGGRPLQLSGLIVVPDRKTLLSEMERFGSILTAGSRYGTLVVTEQERDLKRQCRVRRVQPPVITPLSDKVAEWSWFLRAADPIRYDDAEQSLLLTNKGADQGVENTGNVPVKLGLELTGPLVTPSFWIKGAEWRLNYTIPAGKTVVVAWGDRSVMYGMDDLRYYQSGPWPLLQPGMTMVGFSAVSGTGKCKVIWRSGWL